jgi:hypothetical protein
MTSSLCAKLCQAEPFTSLEKHCKDPKAICDAWQGHAMLHAACEAALPLVTGICNKVNSAPCAQTCTNAVRSACYDELANLKLPGCTRDDACAKGVCERLSQA